MTPLLLQLLKSAAIVAGAGIVLYRFSWREYPALISWMLWEVAYQVATLGGRDIPPVMMLVQDGLCLAVICEVIFLSRIDVRLGATVRTFVAVMAAAKILASLPDLTAMQEWYLFRSYVLWAAFVVLAGITVRRWTFAIPERKVNRVYRVGMTAWVFVLALSGSFVKGGIGYKIFPYTMRTWNTMHLISCAAVAVTVLAMSAAMYLSVPGRKRAAKRPDGRTVTGLIQVERAA